MLRGRKKLCFNVLALHGTARKCKNGKLSARLTELTYQQTGSPHQPCKRDRDKIRDYMERWVTPLRRVTSPTWGPPPPCKQALIKSFIYLRCVNSKC